ncbi:MAG: (Fe-S)-binding protein [Chloroflexi bacterium]|nr:(Fe-S)-binding protein [Chloroflexota bacterium]
MLATRDPILGFLPANLVLLLAIVVAVGLFARSAYHLYRLVRLGRPEQRTDHPAERWDAFLRHVLGQGRLLREPAAGLMHALIFWGFLVITVSTAEMLLGGLIPGLTFGPLTANPVYVLLLDLFEVLVLASVLFAFYRRLVVKPSRLSYTGDALLILGLIATLMLTALLANGLRIAYASEPLDPWAPASAALAGALGDLPAPTQLALHKLFWWAHVLTVLGFLAYLPHSKHLHIVTAPFNVWLRSLAPRGQLPYLDVEAALEQDQPLGASQIDHFTWKGLLDTYTCTECGRCQAACPASISGKPLSPKKLILDLKEHLLEEGPARLHGDGEAHPGKQMVGEVITDEVLWDCTTCRACMHECPVFIEHVPKIVDMRRHLVMAESRFEPEVQRLFDNLEASGNPWRLPRMVRGDWAKGLGIPTMAESPEIEYLYWVGCAGSHDERNMKVARAFARLMQQAGVKFAILATEETCTGDPARRAGHEYLFQTLAQQNVETLNRYGVKKVVTACPHCFNSLKNEYPQLGGTYEVIHHSQFLRELVEAGKLAPSKALEGAVAYHDPCYLGRYNEVYDQPRGVLEGIPGLELREVPGCHRDRAMCCGGGGARVFMEEQRGRRINHLRIEQAMAAQPRTIATACPFCIIMLEDGARAKGVYDDVPVADIAELLVRSCDKKS